MKNCRYFSRLWRLAAALLFLGLFGGPNAFCEQVFDIDSGNLWIGEWQSSNYTSVRGKLFARIPEKLLYDQQFSVIVDIYYDTDSFYKSGKTIQVDFDGMMTRSGRVSGGGDSENNMETIKRFTLKGRPSWSFHVIEYKALLHEDKGLIKGLYKAKWPSDTGEFTLHLADQKKEITE